MTPAVFTMTPDGKVTLKIDVQNVTPAEKHGARIGCGVIVAK